MRSLAFALILGRLRKHVNEVSLHARHLHRIALSSPWFSLFILQCSAGFHASLFGFLVRNLREAGCSRHNRELMIQHRRSCGSPPPRIAPWPVDIIRFAPDLAGSPANSRSKHFSLTSAHLPPATSQSCGFVLPEQTLGQPYKFLALGCWHPLDSHGRI